MQYFFGLILFFFGAALGSFILVAAERYNTGLPFWGGRSICFSCGSKLRKRDLVPVFSYIFLRGRCGKCKSRIPAAALIAEIIMGSLAVIAAIKTGLLGTNFQLIFNFLILTSIFAVILLISIYDLKHFIIPDSFLVAFFVLSFLYVTFSVSPWTQDFSFFGVVARIVSGAVVSLPFFLIFLASRGTWFGFGDVKYIAIIGFFLGLGGGLSAVVLSFWMGAAFSLLALCAKKIMPRMNLPGFNNNLTIKSEIPFGPFLSLGIIISFYLGADLFKINELFALFYQV